MQLSIPVFLSGFLAFHATLVIAQEPTSSQSSSPACAFSCPETNLLSWPLVKRPNTIGYNSFYSIFECVYLTNRPTPQDLVSEHKCNYNKNTGWQALEAAGDNCRRQAIPCPSVSSDSSSEDSENTTPPAFSNNIADEVPPWIQGGRYLLYLIEHPPS